MVTDPSENLDKLRKNVTPLHLRPHRFVSQESHATTVLESRQGFFFTAFYFVFSLSFILNRIFNYVMDPDEWQSDKSLLESLFARLDIVIYVWFFYHLVCFAVVFPLVKLLPRHSIVIQSMSWIVGCSLLLLTAHITQFRNKEMGGPCKIILACESIRFFMKIIAFSSEVVRIMNWNFQSEEVNEKLFNNNPNNHDINNNQERKLEDRSETKDRENVASMAHFCYFLFAPTLVYAPSYPRNESRSYSRIGRLAFHIIALFVYGFFLFKKVFLPLEVVGEESFSKLQLGNLVYMFCGVYGYFLGVAAALGWLHSWHNIWAELLLFADRKQFYGDFYGTYDIKVFFIKWNSLLQNWFFRYIYSPTEMRFGKKTASIAVLLISGCLHDYTSLVIAGILYPHYTLFMPLIIFNGNFFTQMWSSENPGVISYFAVSLMHVLQGLFHLALTLEHFSRKNCPREDDINWIQDITSWRFPHCIVIDD
jgi:hypothetical protein